MQGISLGRVLNWAMIMLRSFLLEEVRWSFDPELPWLSVCVLGLGFL